MKKYEVWFAGDSISPGKLIGTYKSRKTAQNKADKLDLKYGSIKYHVIKN